METGANMEWTEGEEKALSYEIDRIFALDLDKKKTDDLLDDLIRLTARKRALKMRTERKENK